MSKLTILSMGWGVQTWALAAMMALGEIPRPSMIVFADTGHEQQATYDFVRQWAPWLGEHGLSTVTVQGTRTETVREDWSNSVIIPAFTMDAKGNRGQVRRQCTHDWKVMPVRRWVRDELDRLGLRRLPGVVETWMGISWDEAHRMRDSDVAYITNGYPLIDRRLTRADCKAWLERHGLPVPPKSACTFCPYKSRNAWKEMKRLDGPDWQEAVAVDASVRDRRPPRQLFVHPARVPLEQAVSIPEDYGAHQLALDADPGCDSGYCFV